MLISFVEIFLRIVNKLMKLIFLIGLSKRKPVAINWWQWLLITTDIKYDRFYDSFPRALTTTTG